MSKGVSINNFDEVRLALRKELGLLSKKFQNSLTSVKLDDVANTNDVLKLEKIIECLEMMTKLYDSFAKNMELNPTINVAQPEINIPKIEVPDIYVPEVKIPEIKVPEPRVTVNNDFDVDSLLEALSPLRLISRNPTSPLAVRLSDGKRFVDSLNKASKEIANSAEKMGIVFSGGQSGMTSDDYREVLKSSSSVSSVSDSASSVTLLNSNNNRKGFVIFNDSTAILYVKLGSTASTSSFSYRLTPYGTLSETNFRYTGVIDGIWASDASGAARITELT